MTFWVAGAVVVGGAISAAGASSAAGQQAGAAENAQQISQNEFNTIQQQNAPFTQSGYGALSALDYGLGITPQSAGGGAPTATGLTAPGGGAAQPAGAPAAGGSLSSLYNYNGSSGGIGAVTPHPAGGAPTATPTQGMPPAGAAPGAPGAAAPPGQTAGLGYGSLTTPFTTANWQQLSPAYNFQLRQGQQGVQNADAAGAGAMSGSALKDLTDYNQAEANTSFNNAFNQYQTQQGNIFSRLSGIAQLGQSSANNTGQQGTALAGQAAQSATNIGTANASGTVGAANAISGGLSGAAPWLAYGGNQSSGVTAGEADTLGLDDLG